MVKKIIVKSFLAILAIFLYLPIVWLIIFSFTEANTFTEWRGFSFKSYIDLFSGPKSGAIFEAVGNTVIIAVIASLIATFLGTIAAIAVNSMKKKWTKNTYTTIAEIPMINAEIITAISLMLFFGLFKIAFGVTSKLSNMVAVIIAHIAFCTPYVMLNVSPRLARLDKNIYEAALDLGAKPMQAMRKVIIPQLTPGIVTGAIFSFALSIDDFVITKYNVSGFDTISTYIYGTFSGKDSLPTEIRALTTILFLFLLSVITILTIKNNKNIGDKK